jgi:hypothetical protein
MIRINVYPLKSDVVMDKNVCAQAINAPICSINEDCGVIFHKFTRESPRRNIFLSIEYRNYKWIEALIYRIYIYLQRIKEIR